MMSGDGDGDGVVGLRSHERGCIDQVQRATSGAREVQSREESALTRVSRTASRTEREVRGPSRPSRMRTRRRGPPRRHIIANLTCLSDDSVVHVTVRRFGTYKHTTRTRA
ncbi:hypothetical protein DBV15_09265 [Temnothorax longispinosus]|uniref:Uncharacterized protein n=1 Tax=Temnothorax longispinosus TaxID=300112 RepID=A0A4S2KDY9_9HYME|nr:hypothetical protein DBV15_09265 [Temnothorax longispinosus]